MEKANFEKLKQSLVDFIKIPSVRGEKVEGAVCGIECKEALDYALDLGMQLGFEKSKSIDGLVGYLDLGAGDETFGILGHVDVVPAGEGWTKAPFGGEIVDGKIYGRGAMDDKGPIVIILYAIHELLKNGYTPKKRIRIILGADEETGGNPTRCAWESIEKYLETEKMPDIGISPDADFPVINAEKGILNIRLTMPAPQGVIDARGGVASNTVPNKAEITLQDYHINIDGLECVKADTGVVVTAKGRSAHGAKPHDGDNAIVKLLTKLYPQNEQFASLISVYGEGLDIDTSDEVSGRLTVNVGTMEKVGDNLVFVLNIRYPVSVKSEDIVNKLKSTWLGTVEVIKDTLPLYVPRDHYLVKTLLDSYNKVTGEMAEPIAIGGGTYARALPCGVAFGIMFPDDVDTMHAPDEFISFTNIKKAYEIYYEAIKRLCF